MNWYVYIVECNDGTYYTGIALDVAKRVARHNAARGAKYTARRTPVTLRWFEECRSHSEALKKEIRIKALSRSQKQRLIQSHV